MEEDLQVFRKGYFLPGTKKGEAVLLIHGFSGTPLELKPLADDLNRRGYTVDAVLLKGHGTDMADMNACKYTDWEQSVKDEYLKLQQNYQKVYVCGHSMGAILAAYLGEEYQPAALSLICPPFTYKSKASYLAGFFSLFVKTLPWGKEPVKLPGGYEKYVQGYGAIPVKSVPTMTKLIRHVNKKLPQIKSPTQLIYTKKDGFVGPKTLKIFKDKVSCPHKEVVMLFNSSHLAPLDMEREKVFAAVANYFSRF
jgi:carboxylesterase